MTSRRLFHCIVALLIVAGIGLGWLRHSRMGIPLLPGTHRPVWLAEARIDFIAQGEPVTVSLDIPDNPPGFSIFSEQAASPGYGFSIIEDKGLRRGEWSIRHARGPQTLYYKLQVIPTPLEKADPGGPPPKIEPVYWNAPEALAAGQLLENAYAMSSSPESMTRELIKLLNKPEPGQNAALLLGETPLAPLLAKLLNYARIPTRIVLGLRLEDGRRNQQLSPLIEIHDGRHWRLFDPLTGIQGIPKDFLLWHQDGQSLLDVKGASHSTIRFAMMRQSIAATQLPYAVGDRSPLAFLGPQSLPVEEQNMLRMLLILPLGALVVVFMRIMVGVRSSGTFMPILIALSFLQTTLLPGLPSFVAIVALGLLLRGYLSRLNLLLVARIATIVIIVIFIILFSSLLGYQLGFNTGMTVAFFPIIIISWTIERMSILWEDEGPREVFIQGGGSLLVAVLAYLLMRWPLMAHLSFHFPEINLITVALILLMGNYTGYKFSELRRFRAMFPRLGP